MRILILFDDDVCSVVGFLYLNSSAGHSYTKDRKIFINDLNFSDPKSLKSWSRFERLTPTYESGKIVVDVPKNVKNFSYSDITTPGPRDKAIETERKKRFQ